MLKNLFKILGVFLGISLLLFSIFYFIGTSNSNKLNMVQKTKYPNSNMTYDKAFNLYFDSPSWLESTDKNGNPVIQFSGYDSHDSEKVLLQWVLNSKNTYKLYYFSLNNQDTDLALFPTLNKKIYVYAQK